MSGATDSAAALSRENFEDLMAALPRAGAASRLAVAVSGGPDSMALALLVRDWAAARGIGLTALTVDHGLRPDSAVEAATVAGWMAACGISHHVLSLAGRTRGNLQAEARRGRYGLLENWCTAHEVPGLLLAHHLEDQAETVLLRLGRGSGVYGLAAMTAEAEPAWPGAPARLRPLLGVHKERLAATLRAAGQAWIEDPSNRNDAFARVRARSVWPALASLGITPDRLARTASHMARARAALDGQAHGLIAEAAAFGAGGWCTLSLAALRAAHEETSLRALALVLMAVGGSDYAPRLERLERLWARLAAGLDAGVTLSGCRIVPSGVGVVVVRETRAMQGPLALGDRPQIWDGRFLASGDGLTLDRLRPGLRALLPDSALRRVPAVARTVLPAIYDRQGLLAVPALGFRREGAQCPDAALDFLPRHRLPAASFPT